MWLLEPLAKAGRTAVILPKANRKNPRLYNRDLYKARLSLPGSVLPATAVI